MIALRQNVTSELFNNPLSQSLNKNTEPNIHLQALITAPSINLNSHVSLRLTAAQCGTRGSRWVKQGKSVRTWVKAFWWLSITDQMKTIRTTWLWLRCTRVWWPLPLSLTLPSTGTQLEWSNLVWLCRLNVLCWSWRSGVLVYWLWDHLYASAAKLWQIAYLLAYIHISNGLPFTRKWTLSLMTLHSSYMEFWSLECKVLQRGSAS